MKVSLALNWESYVCGLRVYFFFFLVELRNAHEDYIVRIETLVYN